MAIEQAESVVFVDSTTNKKFLLTAATPEDVQKAQQAAEQAQQTANSAQQAVNDLLQPFEGEVFEG